MQSTTTMLAEGMEEKMVFYLGIQTHTKNFLAHFFRVDEANSFFKVERLLSMEVILDGAVLPRENQSITWLY